MIKNISVPNPCHEKWEEMNPQKNGRYCGSCQKVVIDFTNKTEQEIIDYIAANAGKKMCGTFKNEQLQKTNTLPELHINKHEKTIRFLAAVLLVFGMTLFSCNTAEEKKNEVQTETTTGLMIAPVDSSLSQQVDTVSQTIPPPPVTGEVANCITTTGDIISDPIQFEPPDDSEIVQTSEVVGMIAEEMPEFEGGHKAMAEYIQNNIHYPTETGAQGIVYISFIVRKDGSIDDVKVLRGIGVACDNEAVRVVKSMPKWKPGKNNGQNVDIRFNLPIKFKSE